MNAQIRANEFRCFTAVSNELHLAMNTHDRRTAWLAIEEIRGIQEHTEWNTLRARCTAVLSQYAIH